MTKFWVVRARATARAKLEALAKYNGGGGGVEAIIPTHDDDGAVVMSGAPCPAVTARMQ
jgi:hypothetical protein